MCLKNICRKSLLGSYCKISNATVCCEILFLSFLKKISVVPIHPGSGWIETVKSFQSFHHHFYFCPNLHGSGAYWGISEPLKNKNIFCWSQQFSTVYKFTVTGVFFSSFFISMQLVHYIKPLSHIKLHKTIPVFDQMSFW